MDCCEVSLLCCRILEGWMSTAWWGGTLFLTLSLCVDGEQAAVLTWMEEQAEVAALVVSGSSQGWRWLGSLMARAVLSAPSTVIKCRGCCTSPLNPQSESLDFGRPRAPQLRWEVSPWEGVVLFPDMVDQVVLHCPSAWEWGRGRIVTPFPGTLGTSGIQGQWWMQ